MAPSSLAFANKHSSAGSSGDEYNSVSHNSPVGQAHKDAGATPMQSDAQAKSSNVLPTAPMTLHAGITPGPCKSNCGVKQQEEVSFDTMHVKPALALLTVFYLLVLAFLDLFLFAFEMSEFAYMMFSVCSIVFVAAILFAQYGLFSENHYLVLPFFASQAIFTLVVCVIYFRQMAVELSFAKLHPHVFMRLTLLMLHETILTLMQAYALMITWRCINYLYSKGQNSGAPVISRASILVKQAEDQENKNGDSVPLPSSSVKRQVSFVDSAVHDVTF
uniref:Transmembrane protein n=1 Tax=Ditylenchus dipsaci TaxID=166011 RepID=A0A915EMM6_9BILA